MKHRTWRMPPPGALLGLLLLTRILYALVYPLELSGDETYYWDWGRQPAWGYFSKPPLIAWGMALLRTAGLDSELGIRLLAALFCSAAVGLFYALGKDICGPRVALWSAALLALSPANAVLALALTPDAPLLLCWSGALWAFWRWQRGGGLLPAAALVVCLGLGLLAKQTMLAFYPLALLFLILGRDTRHRLLRPDTWLLAAVPLMFLLPVLWWNGQNGWVTLAHTAHHFQPTEANPAQWLKNLGELFGAQILLVGPVTWGLLALTIPLTLWRLPRLDHPARFLALMGALPLLLGAALALRQELQANWLLPFYPAALLGMTAWVLSPAHGVRRELWLRRSLISGAVFMLVTYALPFLPLEQGLAGRQIDPLHGLRGWRNAASQLQSLREQVPGWRDLPLLVQGHRYFVSQLAYRLPDRPRVHRWPASPVKIDSQYEIWGLPHNPPMGDFLIVSADTRGQPSLNPDLADSFQTVQTLGGFVQPIGPNRTRHYRLYLGQGWQGVKQMDDR